MDARDNKGRGSDIVNAERFANSLNKNCLASAQWAIEKNEIASYTLRTYALAEFMHIGRCSNLHSPKIVDWG
jgi:ferritin-like metal-binding protein YciE